MQELGVLLAKCDVSFWKVSLISRGYNSSIKPRSESIHFIGIDWNRNPAPFQSPQIKREIYLLSGWWSTTVFGVSHYYCATTPSCFPTYESMGTLSASTERQCNMLWTEDQMIACELKKYLRKLNGQTYNIIILQTIALVRGVIVDPRHHNPARPD